MEDKRCYILYILLLYTEYAVSIAQPMYIPSQRKKPIEHCYHFSVQHGLMITK